MLVEGLPGRGDVGTTADRNKIASKENNMIQKKLMRVESHGKL